MGKIIQILIADDHPIVRQGLRQTIEGEDGEFRIAGETGDGAETLAAARALRPEIIILDINLPKLDGFQVARSLRDEKIESKVIFLTVHREESFMRKALNLGASGYVLKDSAITDIVAAIRAATENLPFISSGITAYLIKFQYVPEIDNLKFFTPA